MSRVLGKSSIFSVSAPILFSMRVTALLTSETVIVDSLTWSYHTRLCDVTCHQDNEDSYRALHFSWRLNPPHSLDDVEQNNC